MEIDYGPYLEKDSVTTMRAMYLVVPASLKLGAVICLGLLKNLCTVNCDR